MVTLQLQTPEHVRDLEARFQFVVDVLKDIRLGMLQDGPSTFDMHLKKLERYMGYIEPWANKAKADFDSARKSFGRAKARQLRSRLDRDEPLDEPQTVEQAKELKAAVRKKVRQVKK